jgi:hypothetical protein
VPSSLRPYWHRSCDFLNILEEAQEETSDQKDSKPIETKTAVQKLKTIEGTPPQVVETIEAVREWFDSEMPEATSESLLSTRIKASRQSHE